MPTALISIGNNNASGLPAKAIALISIAAQVLSAHDPNRSAHLALLKYADGERRSFSFNSEVDEDIYRATYAG